MEFILSEWKRMGNRVLVHDGLEGAHIDAIAGVNCEGYHCIEGGHGVWTLSALTSQHKNGGVSVGTFVNFIWVTIGENFLSDHISAKKAGKEFKPTGMVIR